MTHSQRNFSSSPATPDSIVATLRARANEELEFLIAGGVAAQLCGSTRMTMDLDLLNRRDCANGRMHAM